MDVKYLKQKNRGRALANIWSYAFMLLMILSNFSLLASTTNAGITHVITFLFEAMLFLFFLEKLFSKYYSEPSVQKRVKHKLYIIIFSLITLFLLFCLINLIHYTFPLKYYGLYFFDPIMIMFVLTISYLEGNNINDLWYKFENIMLVLGFTSIIGWILFSLKVTPNSFIDVTWGGFGKVPGFFYIDYASQGSTSFMFWNNFVRNTGIFLEAPIYAYVLSMAIGVELFLKKDNGIKSILNWKVILLFITMFTTSSTNGLIASLIALFFRILILINNKIIRCFFCFLLPILVLSVETIIETKQGNMYSSYGIRMNDMYSAFQAWLDHPIIGNGLDNIKSVSQYMFQYRQLNGNDISSNGLLSILAYGGIIYFLYYVIPLILSLKVSIRIVCFSLLSIILLSFENVQSSFLVIFTFSYICVTFITKGGYDNEK